MLRQILHVDMDAFFASVEQRDDPSLRGKPVLVGGRSSRSVVAAASYEARAYGARSAMPMMEALRLCPQAIVVEPRRHRYEEVSAAAFAVFRRYTPLVEGLSVDEAFLDVTASQRLFGDGPTIARAIKDDIRSSMGLTASAGVARCKFAAKIASDLEKPDGLVVVPEDVAAFLAPLPIERMWGVGPKTAPRLRALGWKTLGDLAAARPDDLERVLGAWGSVIHRLARGDDPREVDPRGLAKSIGAEQTFEEDRTTKDAIARELLCQASRVAQRLLAEGLSAHTIAVKLKYADFTLLSRRESLPEPVCDTSSIHAAALRALERMPIEGRRVRLTGIAAAGLVAGPPPKLLFDDGRERRQRVEQVVAAVQGKFEGGGLVPATLLAPPRRRER